MCIRLVSWQGIQHSSHHCVLLLRYSIGAARCCAHSEARIRCDFIETDGPCPVTLCHQLTTE